MRVKERQKIVDAVMYTGEPFTGLGFENFPFSDRPDWLIKLIEDGKLYLRHPSYGCVCWMLKWNDECSLVHDGMYIVCVMDDVDNIELVKGMTQYEFSKMYEAA